MKTLVWNGGYKPSMNWSSNLQNVTKAFAMHSDGSLQK